MKLCIITCYNQPDYVRAQTLRAAASGIENIKLIVIKNRGKGVLRYAQVFIETLNVRFRENPDVYLLTFRGYEMLLPIRLLSIGKPLIYDEFINPIEWVVREQRQVEAKSDSGKVYTGTIRLISRVIVAVVSSRIFKWFYRTLIRSVDLVLTDTKSHADISAELTRAPRSKFFDIPVGTDEATFGTSKTSETKNERFTVLYYGNMLPLHGLRYVIETAIKLNNKPIKFVLVGGSSKVTKDVESAIESGANIDYRPWVDYKKLPRLMNQADLCLAGPFGNTFQSDYVITGKAYQYLAMSRPTVLGKNKESTAFKNRKNALIVPQADSDALADTIIWAMKHQPELAEIGATGRTLYDERYSLARLSERLKLILSRLGSL